MIHIARASRDAVLYVWRIFVPMTALGIFLALLLIRLVEAGTAR